MKVFKTKKKSGLIAKSIFITSALFGSLLLCVLAIPVLVSGKEVPWVAVYLSFFMLLGSAYAYMRSRVYFSGVFSFDGSTLRYGDLKGQKLVDRDSVESVSFDGKTIALTYKSGEFHRIGQDFEDYPELEAIIKKILVK